jgi:hypothetical protein
MFRTSPLCLLLVLLLAGPNVRGSEVIYDNTQAILGGGPPETAEYGDQLDLEGTARTLTSLTFFYYADFEPDAHQVMKVRLYSNETPYDNFRKTPTKVLYESGFMPMLPGYNARSISNLNVKLPLDTLTFTIEFQGLKTNEIASLVLSSPPSVGSSFNELWRRNGRGGWDPFLYSITDFSLKANVGLKLVARSDGEPAASQNKNTTSIAMRAPKAALRLAQTFVPTVSGRLDQVALTLDWQGAPVQVSILDTSVDGSPGTNALATLQVETAEAGQIVAGFYEKELYLTAGTNYAIQVTTDNPETEQPNYLLHSSSDDSYSAGKLWSRKEPAGPWQPAALPTGETNIDAAFRVSIVPSAPVVYISSPKAGDVIPFGSAVPFRAEVNLPKISKLYRVRFFDNDQELDQLVNPPHRDPPHEIAWKPTQSGPHKLKVRVEDTFGRPFRSQEHLVTVSPAPPKPVERAIAIERKPEGLVKLRFATVLNEHFHVESSPDCLQWTPAGEELTGTGVEVTIEDEPKDLNQRFYRVLFRP